MVIDLAEIITNIWENVFVIILSALIVAAAGFAYTWFFVPPKYEAVASMYVNNSSFSVGSTSFSISSSEISASNSLVNSYIFLLQSRETLEEVIADTGISYDYDELVNSIISTKAVPNTPAFYVTVSSSSPQEAELIANSIAKILPQRISEIIDGASMRIVDHAIIPAHRISPSYTRSTVLYGVLGAIAAVIWCLFHTVFNDLHNETIGNSDSVLEQYPQLQVLAFMPDMNIPEKNGYYSSSYYGSKKEKSGNYSAKQKSRTNHLCENMNFVAHEACKRMRTNILFIPSSLQNNDSRIIGITSAQPGDGKSTTIVNLAYCFAELGKTVLLIDADMRLPSISGKLGITMKTGIVDLLNNSDDISSALYHYKSITGDVHFDIVCGDVAENASELLSSPRFTALLDALRGAYDFILIDLPPVDAVVDALIVGKHTDGMIFVAIENWTLKKAFNNSIKQLETSKTKILGLVFNNSPEATGDKYKYRY